MDQHPNKRFNTEILDNFLNNRECLQAFLDSTGVESLKNLVAYDAYLFESDEIANRSQASRNEYVNGFVISAQNKKIYVIPSRHRFQLIDQRFLYTANLQVLCSKQYFFHCDSNPLFRI